MTSTPPIFDPAKRNTHSPHVCPTCLTQYTAHRGRMFINKDARCPNGHYETPYAQVIPSSVSLLETKNLFNRRFYHATDIENWHSTILNSREAPYVHIGTKHAANAIVAQKHSSFMYTIRIDSSATISPEILTDEDANTVDGKIRARGGFLSRDLRNDVYRYVNIWESPGSISLLINPLKITVIGVPDHPLRKR